MSDIKKSYLKSIIDKICIHKYVSDYLNNKDTNES